MPERYWPFSSGAGASGTEQDWASMWRAITTSGVVRAQVGDGQKGGLALELALFGDATGMQTKLRVGEMWINGWYYVLDTATLTLPHDPSHATLSRIDRVVIRLDSSARTIAAVVKAGTPGASPSAPALVQSGSIWEESIATVLVGFTATTLTAGNVTDDRRYARAIGGAWAECRVDGAAGVDGSSDYVSVPDAINVDHVHNISTGLISVHLRAGLRAIRTFDAQANSSLLVTQGTTANDATTLYLQFKTDAGTLTNPTNFWISVFGDV